MPLDAGGLARAAFVAIQGLIAIFALLAWRAGPPTDPRSGRGLRNAVVIIGFHLLAFLCLPIIYQASTEAEAWRLPVYLGVWMLVILSFLPQVMLIGDEALRRKSFHRLLPFHAVGCLLLGIAAVVQRPW